MLYLYGGISYKIYVHIIYVLSHDDDDDDDDDGEHDEYLICHWKF